MLIQCSSCGAQAKLPDSKEGAKVRCPSCQHVYVARPRGAAGRSRSKKEDPTKYFIIGGAVLAALIIAVLATRGGDETVHAKPEPEPAKKDEGPYVDPMGWNGPVVQLARDLHKAAFSGSDAKLLSKLDAESAYAIEAAKPAPQGEGEAAEGDEETAPAEAPERPLWSAMSQVDRITWSNERVARALTAGADGAVIGWKPYDGSVISLEGGMAVVHLRVQARDTAAGLDDRWTAWTLKNLDGESGPEDRWRWIDVERHLTPEELAKLNRRSRKKAEKKTLSDGSVVYESETREITFDDDVSAEDRARYTKLVNDLVADLDAPPRFLRPIREELSEAGKPAIPALLTKMSDLADGLDEDLTKSAEDLNRIFFIHEIMRDITGMETTFDVSIEMGATPERIRSGVKQWFGWYDRKYKRFDGIEETGDPLADDPDFQPRTPEEIRQYNKALKEQLEAERRRKEGDG